MTTTLPPAQPSLALELMRPANLLSLVRIPLAGVAIAMRHQPIAVLTLMAVAGISDMLDGYVARRTGTNTRVGGWLDPVCDKIFVVAVLVAVWIERRPPAWLPLMALAREMFVVPLSLFHLGSPGRHARAIEFKARPVGKATTVVQFVVLVALLLGRMQIAAASAVVAGIVGALAGIDYIASSSQRPNRGA